MKKIRIVHIWFVVWLDDKFIAKMAPVVTQSCLYNVTLNSKLAWEYLDKKS